MKDVSFIRWSSDGKTPYDECSDSIHVFSAEYNRASFEGLVCDCGKTYWTYETCPHCHQHRGKAIEKKG